MNGSLKLGLRKCLSLLSFFPWQDGWSMCPVYFYWHTLAAEPLEHCSGHHCASFTLECWEMLWRLQHSPCQRMRPTHPDWNCSLCAQMHWWSKWTEPKRAFIFESLIFKLKKKINKCFPHCFGQSPTVCAGPFWWLESNTNWDLTQ